MEDRLSRFLFADFEAGLATVRPPASAVAGFAAAAIEINGLFAESKVLLRTRAVSVHYQDLVWAKINKVKHDPRRSRRGDLYVITGNSN
jgi:hypothetical protein